MTEGERHRGLFDQSVKGFPCWTGGSKQKGLLEESRALEHVGAGSQILARGNEKVYP